MTKLFSEMTDQERNEVRMYGCTVEDMRDVALRNLRGNKETPQSLVCNILSACQRDLAHDDGGKFDLMLVEDVRQAMNRAKWILINSAELV
jgi:hypothetical protein